LHEERIRVQEKLVWNEMMGMNEERNKFICLP